MTTRNTNHAINNNAKNKNISKNWSPRDKKIEQQTNILDSTKRFIPIVPPEEYHGNIEYKRQVHQSSEARLRTLATQMSFRLDEGNGICIYRIGVEDEGFHSLLDYNEIAESARILECVARHLNAVVVRRTMIQNEVAKDETTGTPILIATTQAGEASGCNTNQLANNYDDEIIEVDEPSIFGDSRPSNDIYNHNKSDKKLRKEAGVFTRAELTVKRIRTHLLDQSPLSPMEWVNATAPGGGMITTVQEMKTETESAVELRNITTASVRPPHQQAFASSPSGGNMSIDETLSSRNIRVAVLGDVDAGKSTLIGTLTTSSLDDGKGRNRTSTMKHRHEIETGRTSTISTHLMGFRSTGKPIIGRDTLRTDKLKTEDEIALEAYRVITLMDLAGHEKYLKTTIHGISSGMSDYALILVDSRHPPTQTTQEHLKLCYSLRIPVIVVFTKVDGCSEGAWKMSKERLLRTLKNGNKPPFFIRNEQDIATSMDKLHTLVPILAISCVTGTGIQLLQKMLFSLPKRRRHENKVNRTFEFLVEDIFNNVPGVGTVVSGFVNAGELTVGADCTVHIGPTDDGKFITTVAKSAHIARIDTSHITSGQSACLAFSLDKDMRMQLRRGMVVLKDSASPPTSTRQFDAEIFVLKGEATTVRSQSYQAYVHILNVRQSAIARNIEVFNTRTVDAKPGLADGSITTQNANSDEEEKEDCKDDTEQNNEGDNSSLVVLRRGSRAKIRFEFAQRPEYIRPGMRMLFRDGRVGGVGIITATATAITGTADEKTSRDCGTRTRKTPDIGITTTTTPASSSVVAAFAAPQVQTVN